VKGGDPTTDNYVVTGGSFDERGAASGTNQVPAVAQTVTADMYRSGGAVAGNNDQGVRNCFVQHMAVRRLLPVECEKLQGMEPNWTLVPYRGKPASDGPRYKAIGNSWAVPVLNYIGRRILEVEALREV
jgi:DNA (cytosine-5)-methyltransferase 1